MRRALLSLLTLPLLLSPAAAGAQAYDAHPRLVVIVVIDQFRGDYMARYHADFKPNGFRLFQDRGANFTDCFYNYANTVTAAGHAAIGTGAYSDGNGIAANQWWDLARNSKRPISSVEDERYFIVGDAATCTLKDCTGASPRNLMASTVGDELRLATQGQAKLFGVSLKDRAAILPAGFTANAAYWIDHASGHFVSSSYYLTALPQWAKDFNASDAIAQATTTSGVLKPGEPVKDFYDQVGETPSANTYELAFSKALIQGEHLGKHEVTDMLTISLSANDLEGHHYGPDSAQERQMVDGLDADLDSFFSWLDAYLADPPPADGKTKVADKTPTGGLANVILTLTADHGVAPTAQVSSQLGLPGAAVNLHAVIDHLNDAMNAKFSPGDKVEYVLTHQSLPYLQLDAGKFERAAITEEDAENAVRDALPAALAHVPAAAVTAAEDMPKRLPATPTLAYAYTRVQLARGEYPPSEFGQLLAHSYARTHGWYVMAMLEAFQMEGGNPTGTTHYSPYSYDRHVPLAFYGAQFARGTYHGRVEPVDMAATLASVLGINQPSSSVGHVLTQALLPTAATDAKTDAKPARKPHPAGLSAATSTVTPREPQVKDVPAK